MISQIETSSTLFLRGLGINRPCSLEVRGHVHVTNIGMCTYIGLCPMHIYAHVHLRVCMSMSMFEYIICCLLV